MLEAGAEPPPAAATAAWTRTGADRLVTALTGPFGTLPPARTPANPSTRRLPRRPPLERVWKVNLASGFDYAKYYLDAHVGPISAELLDIAGR